MPKNRDLTMLRTDSKRFLIALADSELEPKDLAEKAGVSPTIVYAARKGIYIKPIYLGKLARALDKKVEDLII